MRELAIVIAVVALDRATKLYIQGTFSFADTKPVIPGFFNIVHVENPGAAFGMLADSPTIWSKALLASVSIAVMTCIALMLWRPVLIQERFPKLDFGMPNTPLIRTALALVLGGAMGNLWDRLFRGTVTDFLQFFFGSYEYPSFNVADTMIDIGAGLLLIGLWLTRERRPAAR